MCAVIPIAMAVAAVASYAVSRSSGPDDPSYTSPPRVESPAPTPPLTAPRVFTNEWLDTFNALHRGPPQGQQGAQMSIGGGAQPLDARQTPVNAQPPASITQLRNRNAAVSSGVNASSASTLLTGPQGADDGAMQIGRNTLLGM